MQNDESREVVLPNEQHPSPQDTGATGNQHTAVTHAGPSSIVVGTIPADADHLGAVLGDHIPDGSPTTMAFAVAAFRDAHASRELLREQLERTGVDRDSARERYHEEAKKSAVLQAQLQWASRFRRFQSWAFGLGGVVAGAGLGSAMQVGTVNWPHGLLTLCGLVMMWLGAPLTDAEN